MSEARRLRAGVSGAAPARLTYAGRMRRDEHDPSKWHLAEDVALGGRHAETGVIRFVDGTSESLPPSLFSTGAPVSTIFL